MKTIDRLFVNRISVAVLATLALFSPVTWTITYTLATAAYYAAWVAMYGSIGVLAVAMAVVELGILYLLWTILANSLTFSSRMKESTKTPPVTVNVESVVQEVTASVEKEQRNAPVICDTILLSEGTTQSDTPAPVVALAQVVSERPARTRTKKETAAKPTPKKKTRKALAALTHEERVQLAKDWGVRGVNGRWSDERLIEKIVEAQTV